MKRRMTILVEKESDGLGYHAVVIDREGDRRRVRGYSWSRFETWRRGVAARRVLKKGDASAIARTFKQST